MIYNFVIWAKYFLDVDYIIYTYLSLRCLLSWSFLFPLVENEASQCLHAYGFSPVCLLKCTFRLPFSRNCIVQNGQLKYVTWFKCEFFWWKRSRELRV